MNLPLDQYGQTLQGGLIQEFLPGNIINANLLGYTTRFTTNTPIYQVGYSLARFNQDNSRGDIVQVMQGENGIADNTQTQADSDFEKKLRALLGIIGAGTLSTATGIGVDKTLPAEGVAKSDYCKDYPSWFRPICDFSVDGSKRVGLLVAGLLLLGLGIWALK